MLGCEVGSGCVQVFSWVQVEKSFAVHGRGSALMDKLVVGACWVAFALDPGLPVPAFSHVDHVEVAVDFGDNGRADNGGDLLVATNDTDIGDVFPANEVVTVYVDEVWTDR